MTPLDWSRKAKKYKLGNAVPVLVLVWVLPTNWNSTETWYGTVAVGFLIFKINLYNLENLFKIN